MGAAGLASRRGGSGAFSIMINLASVAQLSAWGESMTPRSEHHFAFAPVPHAARLLRHRGAGSRRDWMAADSACMRATGAMAARAMSSGAEGKAGKAKKVRLDELLVLEGLAANLKEAAALCMASKVLVSEQPVSSPALKVSPAAPLRIRGQKEHPWVSRGGMKLAHALEEFPTIRVDGALAVDVGCSTGGFTEVLLKHGARRVYAVDVGYGQLALSLRNDERVVVMERTNARNLTRSEIPEELSLIVCDASFIPLRKVLPAAMALCRAQAEIVALIKPQFEAHHDEVESGSGVVRDEAVRKRVCDEVKSWLAGEGWEPRGLTTSPIKGPAGNVEFVVHAVRVGTPGR